MSVQNELERLKKARESLQDSINENYDILRDLDATRKTLVERAEALSIRTSSLAQTLLRNVLEELEKINKKIAEVEKKYAEIEKKFADINKKIVYMQDNPSLYIKEQSSMMISTFFEYMSTHLEEFGTEITKDFCIKEVTTFLGDRYGGCDIPTGNIGIYDQIRRNFVVCSKNFYFDESLYTIYRGNYDDLKRGNSEWYKVYLNQFISVLLEDLKKNYPYDEIFKLTIDEPNFTLELV